MSEYPEHEKLKAVKPQVDAVASFLEYLDAEHLRICKPHEHTDDCYGESWVPGIKMLVCGFLAEGYEPVRKRIEEWLAEHFEIDQNKLDDEKRAMLDELRRQNHARDAATA